MPLPFAASPSPLSQRVPCTGSLSCVQASRLRTQRQPAALGLYSRQRLSRGCQMQKRPVSKIWLGFWVSGSRVGTRPLFSAIVRALFKTIFGGPQNFKRIIARERTKIRPGQFRHRCLQRCTVVVVVVVATTTVRFFAVAGNEMLSRHTE